MNLFSLDPEKEYKATYLDRILWKLNFEIDHNRINNRLLELSRKEKPDFIFVVKGTYLYPGTLRELKKQNIRLVSWSLDDMYARHNRTY